VLLPPDRGDSHAFTPAYCRYSFVRKRSYRRIDETYCRTQAAGMIAVENAGTSGDLRHGQEHRAAKEEHPGERGFDDGSSNAAGDEDSSTQHGGMSRPPSAQVEPLSTSAHTCPFYFNSHLGLTNLE